MASPISLGKDVLGKPDLSFEWLETNGLGAYASSTVLGCNTRKYHGLLVSPAPGSTQRFVFLSRIDAVLYTDSGTYELSTIQYPSAMHPTGYRFAEQFVLDDSPLLRFAADDWELSCRIVMRFEQPAVLLKYALSRAKGNALLRLRPLLAYRDFNATGSENDFVNWEPGKTRESRFFTPYEGLPPIHFSASAQIEYNPSPDWFRSTEYLREFERGYDFREDLFSPGYFEAELTAGSDLILQASMGRPEEKPAEAFEAERIRRQRSAGAGGQIEQSAAHFLITAKRAGKPSVLAGFPWFGEWGRDAMIALPGLTLCRDKPDEALAILESFASFEKDGLFPNQLDVYGGSGYNTVDASLWFFWAAQMLVRHTGRDDSLTNTIIDTMKNILTAYVTGRVPFGEVLPDGLLAVGSADTQLTWMDAKVYGKPVTPRFGRPVEINALWINALEFYAGMVDDPSAYELSPLKRARESIQGAFIDTFWLEQYGYLADVVYPDSIIDASIRPNQIFAVSLPHSPVSDDKAKRIVDTVERHLLTPYGLRTLTPNHVGYRGRYEGSQESRDAAYHQGTVWPWLIGHFVEAYLRVYSGNRERVEDLKARLLPLFEEHPLEAGLGSISEVFDGDAPHRPGGCPAQAWSVAEVLRASKLIEEALS